MIRSIIKEVIIVLLLLVAIILALGILFYDYIPTNKTVPSVAEYKTSETIKNEITDTVVDNQEILVTYEITEQDLKNYEKTKDYKKGKANPFSTYVTTPSGTNDKNNVANTGDGTTSVDPSGNSESPNGSTFYKDTGTK